MLEFLKIYIIIVKVTRDVLSMTRRATISIVFNRKQWSDRRFQSWNNYYSLPGAVHPGDDRHRPRSTFFCFVFYFFRSWNFRHFGFSTYATRPRVCLCVFALEQGVPRARTLMLCEKTPSIRLPRTMRRSLKSIFVLKPKTNSGPILYTSVRTEKPWLRGIIERPNKSERGK